MNNEDNTMKIESNMPWGNLKKAVRLLDDNGKQTESKKLFSALKKPEPPQAPYLSEISSPASDTETKQDSKSTAEAPAST